MATPKGVITLFTIQDILTAAAIQRVIAAAAKEHVVPALCGNGAAVFTIKENLGRIGAAGIAVVNMQICKYRFLRLFPGSLTRPGL